MIAKSKSRLDEVINSISKARRTTQLRRKFLERHGVTIETQFSDAEDGQEQIDLHGAVEDALNEAYAALTLAHAYIAENGGRR
jgi:hypothetical protein